MTLPASSAVALEVESGTTGSTSVPAVADPFLGGPVVPLAPRPPGGSWTWEPEVAVTPTSYPELHVIAGTVLDLTALCVSDNDSNPPNVGLTPDVYWDRTIAASGGETLETVYDPNGSTPTSSVASIVWRAPLTECVVTVTRTAGDWLGPGEQSGTNDPAPDPVTQTIHVHELEVYEMPRSGDLGLEALHIMDASHAYSCDWWDAFGQPTSDLRYSRDGAAPVPYMLFAGGTIGAVELRVRARHNDYAGPVVPVVLRLRASWPGEEAPNGGPIWLTHPWTDTVSSLPFDRAVESCMADDPPVSGSQPYDFCPLDDRVTFGEDALPTEVPPYVPWDFRAQVYGGFHDLVSDLWQYGAESDVQDGSLSWMATTHAPNLLDGDPEVTPKRAESVCRYLAGERTHEGLARRASAWVLSPAGAGLTFSLDTYMAWRGGEDTEPLDEANAWCQVCQGDRPLLDGERVPVDPPETVRNPADCISCANLAVKALQLVGVGATPVRMYPHRLCHVLWILDADWLDPASCWADNPAHGGNRVGYRAGGHNQFEGGFETSGRFYTVAPQLDGDHPWDIIVPHWGTTYECAGWDWTPNGDVWVWHLNGEGGGHTLVTEDYEPAGGGGGQ